MTWPVTVTDGPVALRPLRGRDGRSWKAIRLRNQEWLKEWEATLPPRAGRQVRSQLTLGRWCAGCAGEARAGKILPWAMTFEGQLVGQLTVGGITMGSLRAGYIGYWIDQSFAGRGLLPPRSRWPATTAPVSWGCIGLRSISARRTPPHGG